MKPTLAALLLLTVHAMAANPVMPGADPHATIIDGTLWLHPTRSKGGGTFLAFSSKDLVHWQERGPILDFKDIPWVAADGRAKHGAWAPCLVAKGGKYYFYFSAGPQDPTHPSRIGVATGDSPAGPFKDSGKPLLSGGNGFEAIDPMVFINPADKRPLLYAGGSAGSKLRVFELKPEMTSILREIPVETPPQFTEGAFIHHHGSLYHLTYSHGNYRDDTYSVHYATSTSATGPWTYRGVLLKSDDRHKGPGHHAIVEDPKLGWLIVYHRWEAKGPGPYTGSRQIAIDRITYGADGFLKPVMQTDEGVSR
ncbi:family 43 glycosylhydrolase [Luteolibacter sp. LG18]|uniref:family 43 glycosylhydrolase n=1 Tax=Luteolibacter sp. LG18 TaxID=2819286 RepID=UPI002B2CE14F|nr:hypothetical protein llg_05400 [Luteolibacter sp. LG18]